MADTYVIGSIPPITVWEGEQVVFTVKRRAGNANFAMTVTPTPKGRISIHKDYGTFAYTPAAEDREELTVTVKAGADSADEQTFSVMPQPRLPSDFRLIEHKSEPPAADSNLYVNFSEQSAGKALFNNEADFDKQSDAEIETKKVTVSGVKLVIEQNDDAGSLYKRLHGRANLRELTLCADEVVFRDELHVPGTEVTVYARKLSFENRGRINTTPKSVKSTAKNRDEGLRGQNAGNVYLLAENVETKVFPSVIMNGGAGQPARLGRKGKDGTSKAEWDGRYFAKTTTPFGDQWFDVSGKIREISNGHKPVSAEIWRQAGLSPFYKEQIIIGSARRDDLNGQDYAATKDVPTSGSPPDPYPGHPGHGGNGGTMFSNSRRLDYVSVYQCKPGDPGTKAADIGGSRAGEPRKWCVIKSQYYARTVEPDIYTTFVMLSGETWDGPGATAPDVNPETPAAKAGGRVCDDSITGAWLHPAMVRAFIPYAQDMMLSGHEEGLADRLKLYRNTLAKVVKEGGFPYKLDRNKRQDKFVASTLEGELTALIQRLEGPYDYFGNPAGWVPMLSFQANKALFDTELDEAIRAMFLAHWIETTQNRTLQASETLKKAITSLRAESDQALADFGVAQKQVEDLEDRLDQLNKELNLCQQAIEKTESQTRQQLQHDVKLEHILRSSGKILGGVLQLIPVGQPVAGAFGKSFTALSKIDLDHPKDSAGKILGPLAKVAGTKIATKASKVFSELSTAKKKEETQEQKDFKKALAEERLEKQVETYLEEEKEAKDQIIAALSEFAVPEEEIDKRLEKILAECPAYKKDIEELKSLNKKKAAFSRDLLAALHTIDEATATILKSQLGLIRLRDQLDVTLEGLNLEALQAVRGMGQRARDRLLLYQYYMVKSYQYLMLKDLPLIDYRCEKLFRSFVKVLVKETGKADVTLNPIAESPNGMLTDQQFEAISVVFRDLLKEIAKEIIDWYQKHPPRQTGELPVSLTDEQLETLNAHRQLDLDLLPRLDRQREDIRITSIETDSVRIAKPLPKNTIGFTLTYRHDGISRIRRGGVQYVFRSGQYRLAGDGEASADQYRNDKVYWASSVKYDTAIADENKRVKVTESVPDTEETSLVRSFISGNAAERNPLVSFRPSAWTRLRIIRSGEYEGKITSLTLRINFVAHSVAERVSTVLVLGADGIEPLIRCHPPDLNQRADGYGQFVRTFDQLKSSPVTLRAPKRYGQRSFLGWRQGRGTDLPSSKDPVLVLKLDKDYIVEPVYEPLYFVPKGPDNQPWPRCPVRWKFSAWTLVNNSATPITISRLAWTPVHQNFLDGLIASVNDPEGSEQIKLSFDSLMLAEGGSAKISVCTNPGVTGGPTSEITFGWDVDDVHYAAFFKAQGDFAGMRKRSGSSGWSEMQDRFDVDLATRTLKFK